MSKDIKSNMLFLKKTKKNNVINMKMSVKTKAFDSNSRTNSQKPGSSEVKSDPKPSTSGTKSESSTSKGGDKEFNPRAKFTRGYGKDKSKFECFRCGKMGHLTYDCPEPKDFVKPKSKGSALMVTLDEKQESDKPPGGTFCFFDPIERFPNACMSVKINGVKTIACDDTGATHTLISLDLLSMETRSKMKKWNSGPLMGVTGETFVPEGVLDNVSIETGLITTIVNNVGVLKSIPVQVLLGDSWRRAAKVRISSEEGRRCYKTFDGVEWNCIRPPDQEICTKTNFTPAPVNFSGITMFVRDSTLKPELDSDFEFSCDDSDKLDYYEKREFASACFSLTEDMSVKNIKFDKEVENLLMKNEKVFQIEGEPLSEIKGFEMEIEFKEKKEPIHRSAYRSSYKDREFMDETTDKMIELGVIEEAHLNPYASPAIVVSQPYKVTQPRRFCIDYREVNKITKPQFCVMPIIEDLVDELGQGFSIFTSVDAKSAYWQLKVRVQDREKTGFCTPSGVFVACRAMFGLRNAPAAFQKVTNEIVKRVKQRLRKVGLQDEVAFVGYLDDFSIASRTKENHLVALQIMFDVMMEVNLKLSIDKISVMLSEMRYLGYDITKDGKLPDRRKIEALVNYPPLTDVDKTRSFVFAASYYRRHVRNFAAIAKPLTDLLKQNVEFVFDEKCQNAFETLKRILGNPRF